MKRLTVCEQIINYEKNKSKRSTTQKSKYMLKQRGFDLETFLAQSIEKLFLLILYRGPSPPQITQQYTELTAVTCFKFQQIYNKTCEHITIHQNRPLHKVPAEQCSQNHERISPSLFHHDSTATITIQDYSSTS